MRSDVRRAEYDRVAVIGDIHGRYDLLRPLLDRLDRQVLVAGDVCDRGPDTRACVDALIEVGADGVLGNHDLWFAKWSAGDGFDRFALSPKMGGHATLDSYGATRVDDWRNVPRDHAAWFAKLALVLDLHVAGTPYWLIHAGVPSHRELTGLTLEAVVPFLAENWPADLLWPPNDPEEMLPVDRTIIMGHRPRPEPLDSGSVLAIDTGAGAGLGRLTAVLLPERTFLTVGA